MSERITKTAVLVTSMVLLTLAAFGLGVNVGRHSAHDASTSISVAGIASFAVPSIVPAAYDSETELIDTQLFNEAWTLLEKQFYGELPNGEEITYNAIRGQIDRLDDKHTAFLDPTHAEISNAIMEGHFEGIGAQVEEAEGGGVLINYLYPDQPADKAGIMKGDIIIAVDGKDVTTMSLNDAIDLIRGPDGSTVVLTLKRVEQQPFDLTIVRARIEIPTVESKTLAEDQIEYIALTEFSSVAPGRLAEALRSAVNKKPVGIVLDLRGNPGGYLEAAVRIGSYFVPDGPIVIERFKDGTEQVYQRQGNYILGDTPLVVLVDSGSASASEIVAGAIQDADTGILLGETTYGKGSVQLVNSLSDGSQLRVTVARWFTPLGRGIHEAGLEPDIVVPFAVEDAAADRDAQLDSAIEYLLGKQGVPASPSGTPTVSR